MKVRGYKGDDKLTLILFDEKATAEIENEFLKTLDVDAIKIIPRFK